MGLVPRDDTLLPIPHVNVMEVARIIGTRSVHRWLTIPLQLRIVDVIVQFHIPGTRGSAPLPSSAAAQQESKRSMPVAVMDV